MSKSLIMTARCQLREIKHNSPDYEEAVRLREKVLRKPLGLGFTPDELTKEAGSIHLGSFIRRKLAGCLVLKPIDEHTVQMRQVVVEPLYQGGGIGKGLVRFAEEVSLQKGFSRLILHAREPVIPFYEKLGYIKRGKPFTEVTIPHQEMVKELIKQNEPRSV